MNYNEQYIPPKLKAFENTAYRNIGKSKSLEISGIISGTGTTSENQLKFRLQEMEELNALLENLVEQRTDKLIEVVATNTKFISIIAHDLRSPFSSIFGILEILKEKLKDPDLDEFEKFVDIASNSATRTLNLLDNLLIWTISQNKAKSFTPVKINLLALLKEEIESINTSASQKQITLTNIIAPDLNVTADLQMLKTILRNLISNAIKYTNTGGEVSISASEIKQFVEISIKDSGIGISYEAQRKLFKIDSFQSTVGTNNEKGTGLGLIICKEFVEMHGGNLWVESDPENLRVEKGSKFVFTLPHYL